MKSLFRLVVVAAVLCASNITSTNCQNYAFASVDVSSSYEAISEPTEFDSNINNNEDPSPEEVINILPFDPYTTSGSILKVKATPISNKKIIRQEWKDLKTGMAANYKLIDVNRSVLTVDATTASVGSINLEYLMTDINGKVYSRKTTINIMGEDRGDLPNANEASHLVPLQPLVFLGNGIDTELHNQPSLSAGLGEKTRDGDDHDASDDEDGIFQPISIKINQEATFYAEVVNNSTEVAHLTAFVDWNKDGDYDDPNEISSAAISPNPKKFVPLNFIVPSDAKLNTDIYARFRLSTDLAAIIQFSGQAWDGEVEDYVIRVVE